MRMTYRIAAALITLVGIVGLAGPAQAQDKPHHGITTVTVYHQPVTPTSVIGSGLGTVRTFFTPIAVNGKAADDQYLTGTLTTIAEGIPGNKEIRSSNLVFVFGDIRNQLVVGGASMYAAAGATLPPGDRVIRPVIGGSGIYDGAVGQVISTNYGASGWTHLFKIRIPK